MDARNGSTLRVVLRVDQLRSRASLADAATSNFLASPWYYLFYTYYFSSELIDFFCLVGFFIFKIIIFSGHRQGDFPLRRAAKRDCVY